MKLRRATVSDARALAVVGPATFLETFANDHPGDALIAFTETHHSTAFYEALLSADTTAAWIVEHDVGAPIGYAVMTSASLPGSDPATDVELKRIYMFSKWQGAGLGRALIEAVEAEAIARGARRLVLSVYTKNEKAIRFYSARGYETIGRAMFPGFTEAYSDFVMAKTF
ncbi:MAG: family N-acetyltransferase [Sphingomonadales bacterium]|nr:family N-acetyltransferase [Sphingomonadales bacterium]